MEKFKAVGAIDLKVSQYGMVQSKTRIVRTTVIDPAIVMPIMLSEHEVVLLGQSPGNTIVGLWDETGMAAVDLQVVQSSGAAGLKPTRTESLSSYRIDELKPTDVINLKVSQGCFVKMPRQSRITAMSFSDPAASKFQLDSPVARTEFVDSGEIILLGKKSGTATLKLLDNAGNVSAINLRVTEDDALLPARTDRKPTQAQRAACYFKHGKYLADLANSHPDHQELRQQSIAAFDIALAIDPNYTEAYINRGHAREVAGILKGASADFNQAKQIKNK